MSGSPPPLPFDLREHRWSIAIFWTFIAAEVCFIPIACFYGLWFGTRLDHGALFAIITSVFGFVSGYEYTLRAFQLARPDPKYRPRSSKRWYFDATQITLAIPYTIMTAILVGFSIPREPLVRGLATPFALADVILGTIFLWSAVGHVRLWRVPCRVSSTRRGERWPPFAFVVLEDVVTVDGSCPGFREAVQERWNASPRFRQLLLNLTWFWGTSSLIVGIGTVTAIATVDELIGYGLGWGLPSLHAAGGCLVTVFWSKSALAREHREWNQPEPHK